MTITQASIPVCDAQHGNITYTHTGPDSVDACGEYGHATLDIRYRQVGASGLIFDRTCKVQRIGTAIQITTDDGSGESVTGTSCPPGDAFSIDALSSYIPYGYAWDNFPCHPFLSPGYTYAGYANVEIEADERFYSVSKAEEEVVIDHHICDLSYSCVPNRELCE